MNTDADALPVARLEDTLLQYITAMGPISSEQELKKIEEDVEHFRQKDGTILQKKLEEYAGELEGKSWLFEYSRQRFLSLRCPLTIVGNFTLELQTPPWTENYSTAQIAAMLAYSVGQLYLNLFSGMIPVPKGSNESVLNEQMCKVLGSARIPRPCIDDYVTFPKEQIRNFGLFYRNHYYLVELINKKGELLEISQIYSSIVQIMKKTKRSLSVNFHTSAYSGSETCSRLLCHLTKEPENKQNLEAVERSLFHLAIKDTKRAEEPVEQMLFSDTTDLWPYKPWNFTLYTDGALMANNEHTAADGVTNAHLYQYLLDYMSSNRWEFMEGLAGHYQELIFSFSEKIENELEGIRKKYIDSVSGYRVRQWEYGPVDWRKWKALSVGRDALIQLSFLFASRSVYNRLRCIHESVSTAQYYQGRTSCLRPVTKEMCAAADGFEKGLPAGDILELLQKASKMHSDNIRKAKNNICFVRHGAGLQQMVQLFGKEIGVEKIPPIFSSKGYVRFCTQEISTSTIGNRAVKSFAFSPQIPDGIGIGYTVEEESLRLNISWNQEILKSGENFIDSLNVFFNKLNVLQSELAGEERCL